MLTFPLLGHVSDFGLQTEGVVRPVTTSTKVQLVFICGFAAEFAGFAVEAFPI